MRGQTPPDTQVRCFNCTKVYKSTQGVEVHLLGRNSCCPNGSPDSITDYYEKHKRKSVAPVKSSSPAIDLAQSAQRVMTATLPTQWNDLVQPRKIQF